MRGIEVYDNLNVLLKQFNLVFFFDCKGNIYASYENPNIIKISTMANEIPQFHKDNCS